LLALKNIAKKTIIYGKKGKIKTKHYIGVDLKDSFVAVT
jgi:hypothetical protein